MQLFLESQKRKIMANRLYLYPIWLRIWHMINALLFLALIVTGLSMQYSPVENPLIEFQTAIAVHNIAGILIIAAYIIFMVTNFSSSNKKYYVMKKKGLMDRLMKQSRYYAYGMFKGESTPFPVTEDEKFNPLQKLSYVGVIYILLPILMITGLALLYPEFIVHKVFGLNGTMLTALLHMFMGFLLTLFLLIHLYFASLSKKKFANFKSMITGWHEH